MSDTYAVILRACAEPARAEVAAFLGRAFALKESTCATIVASAPIVLLAGISSDEAAAMLLVLHGMRREGVALEISSAAGEEQPKIDWPRQPSVFKRELADYARDFRMPLGCPACGREQPLVEYLGRKLGRPGSTSRMAPAAATEGAGSTQRSRAAASQPFTGAQMPEITPFSNAALPAIGSGPTEAVSAKVAAPGSAAGGDAVEEAMATLNELFPDDGGQGIVPNNSDINSLLDQLLPDEAGSNVGNVSGANAVLGTTGASGAQPAQRLSGFSLFLPRINDEARRQKAVKLLTEIAKIPEKDADALSKKMIIPVLKGVSKEEAEAGKQKFAKIGIPARVMGNE